MHQRQIFFAARNNLKIRSQLELTDRSFDRNAIAPILQILISES